MKANKCSNGTLMLREDGTSIVTCPYCRPESEDYPMIKSFVENLIGDEQKPDGECVYYRHDCQDECVCCDI